MLLPAAPTHQVWDWWGEQRGSGSEGRRCDSVKTFLLQQNESAHSLQTPPRHPCHPPTPTPLLPSRTIVPPLAVVTQSRSLALCFLILPFSALHCIYMHLEERLQRAAQILKDAPKDLMYAGVILSWNGTTKKSKSCVISVAMFRPQIGPSCCTFLYHWSF